MVGFARLCRRCESLTASCPRSGKFFFISILPAGTTYRPQVGVTHLNTANATVSTRPRARSSLLVSIACPFMTGLSRKFLGISTSFGGEWMVLVSSLMDFVNLVSSTKHPDTLLPPLERCAGGPR